MIDRWIDRDTIYICTLEDYRVLEHSDTLYLILKLHRISFSVV